MTGHTSSIYSLAFSAESSLLVSGGADWTVRCWDIKNAGGPRGKPKENGFGNNVNGIDTKYGEDESIETCVICRVHLYTYSSLGMQRRPLSDFSNKADAHFKRPVYITKLVSGRRNISFTLILELVFFFFVHNFTCRVDASMYFYPRNLKGGGFRTQVSQPVICHTANRPIFYRSIRRDRLIV